MANRGLREWKDWSLLDVMAEGDRVLVTNYAIEFRGRFHRVELHPGVAFLVPSVPRAGLLELSGAPPATQINSHHQG